MTGILRSFGSLACIAFVALAPASAQDEVQATFEQGVELMRRGHDDEALLAFKKVLALDPSSTVAYELWKSTSHDVWLEMFSKEGATSGEWELVARNLHELVRAGRREHSADPEAIRALLLRLDTEDPIEQRRALAELSAEHGAYVVPHMLGALADTSDEERQVRFLHALSQMGGSVVLPLVEALHAPDAFLRSNVAHALGYIGDRRAAPALARAAARDEDPGARQAAADAHARCGGGDALDGFLQQAADYGMRSSSVMLPRQQGDAIWSWSGSGLVATAVPSFLYAEELALAACFDALDVEPGSGRALAGLARAVSAERALVAQHAAAGADLGAFEARAAGAELVLLAVGASALNHGLSEALAEGHDSAALGIARALQSVTPGVTDGLEKALGYASNAAVRGEAAVALAHASARSGRAVGSGVLATLTDAAAREVVRIAVVIDGDASRSSSLLAALAARGFSASAYDRGTRGLSALYRLPGIDVVFLADRLPDVTADQVLDQIRANPTTAETPVVMVSSDPESVAELFGEKSSGAIASAEQLGDLGEVLEGPLSSERILAEGLAQRAAGALAALAHSGQDISAACDALAGALGRGDGLAIAALSALGRAGSAAHAPAVAALLFDDSRSPEVRVHAGQALAGIFARHGQSDASTVEGLLALLATDEPLDLRRVAAQALGQLDLDPKLRTEVLRAAQADLADLAVE